MSRIWLFHDTVILMDRLQEKKRETRLKLKKIWTGITDKEASQISSDIRTEIMRSELWKISDTLLAYLAFGKEISLDELIIQSVISGKKVFLPRVEGRVINFYRIRNLEPPHLNTSKMGIREPSDLKEKFISGTETLILVPGLGFTRDGKRMGRGGGYYDRFLKNLSKCEYIKTVGICSERAILDDLPAEEHDMKVQNLCSEKGLFRITP